MGIRIAPTMALAFLVAMPAWSQLPLPPAALSDPAGLEAALPELARRALAQLPPDPVQGLEQRFRFQFAVGQYEEAVKSLEEWMQQRTSTPGETVERWLRLDLHARAKLMEARDRIPYAEAFKGVLAKRFARFDDRSAADSAWMLGLPPAAARANLDRQLERFAGRDTLSAAELLEILTWHSTWQAVREFSPALDAAIAVDDAKRFAIDRGVLIKTRDGATIAADVVRPKRLTGPQPAVLQFTIYTQPVIALRDAKDAAARGFAAVFANARGKYLSTDKIVPWETEVQDTWAVVDWISRQPWSNGKVGMFGHSYNGFAQWAAAKNPHPALKTIVPSGASSPGNGLPMQNNVFLTANYEWPLQVTNDRFMGDPALFDRKRWSNLVARWFESGRPLRDIDAIDGTPSPVFQNYLKHPAYDEYWQAMQPYRREFANIRIPVLSLTGYFDDAGAAAVNYLVDHYRYDPKAEHYLVIGPWQHFNVLTSWRDATVYGYQLEPAAQVDTIDLTYQWFGYVLRGEPKPALLKDRINYLVMGANTWRHAPSIAKMANRTLRLYLTNRKTGNRHELSPQRPRAAGFVEQQVDLADRKTWITFYPTSAYPQDADGPARIAYVSAPFDEPVAVDGLVTGELKAAIDRRDFDFTWALYEVMPDGRYFHLTYYLGRASYARDPTTRRLLTPGRITSLPFSQTPLVSKQLSKGSRLLLLVSVNKTPYAQVNYGSGKDVSDESIADAGQPLKIQWHNGSYIDVPLRDGDTR